RRESCAADWVGRTARCSGLSTPWPSSRMHYKAKDRVENLRRGEQMRTIFSSVAVTAALVLAFGLSAATQGNQGAGASVDQNDKYQVKIDNFSFMPASLTVPAGTKVTWT